MSDTNKDLNKLKNRNNYILPILIGMSVGALLGLIAYIRDWL